MASRDPAKTIVAKHFLEEALDRAARKGVKSEELLLSMLDVYIATRLGISGYQPMEVLVEVGACMKEVNESFKTAEFEVGPPLGKGDN